METIDTAKPQLKPSQPGDIICIAGALGDSAAPCTEEGEYLAKCKHVHSVTTIYDGIDPAIKCIMELSGLSAEIRLDNLPFGNDLIQQFDSQLSQLYLHALHEGKVHELLATVQYKHFADFNDKYKKRFGTPLHAIGRIVEGDSTRVNYIENAFGAMPIGTSLEHFC
ncbi:MAG: hypothetical protein J5595_10115 [Bacteroidales bacterium]|nr:hypothetical protein [Bacteroidales bacterium]